MPSALFMPPSFLPFPFSLLNSLFLPSFLPSLPLFFPSFLPFLLPSSITEQELMCLQHRKSNSDSRCLQLNKSLFAGSQARRMGSSCSECLTTPMAFRQKELSFRGTLFYFLCFFLSVSLPFFLLSFLPSTFCLLFNLFPIPSHSILHRQESDFLKIIIPSLFHSFCCT